MGEVALLSGGEIGKGVKLLNEVGNDGELLDEVGDRGWAIKVSFFLKRENTGGVKSEKSDVQGHEDGKWNGTFMDANTRNG